MTKQKGFKGKGNGKKARQSLAKQSRQNRLMLIGAGIIVLALVGLGMGEVFQSNQRLNEEIQLDGGNLQAVDIADGQGSALEVDTASLANTDLETLYLGPPTNPDALAVAEAGQAGMPTLVWFHADW